MKRQVKGVGINRQATGVFALLTGVLHQVNL